MQSLKIFTPKTSNEGFTILEVLVVIGIITLLGGLGLFLNMDSYRSYSFNYEERLLIGIIQRARSQATANLNEDRHGVCVIGSDYVLFEGNTCASGHTFPKAPTVSIGPVGVAVVFNQLDGSLCTTACSVTAPLVITLTGEGRTENITINNEGRIDW